MRLLIALAPTLLAACGGAAVQRGDVSVCLDGGRPSGQDQNLEIDGTVTAIEAGTALCPWTASVAESGGSTITVGFGVLDADGVDITPAVDLTAGGAVHLTYRYRLVWGDVAGFVLTDADGPAVAVEEGAWGGALVAGDVPGLAVQRGADVIAREATECQPIEGYAIVFAGDADVSLVPIVSGPVAVGGATMTAMAVAAYDYGDATSCQVSDQTGETSWVVVR